MSLLLVPFAGMGTIILGTLGFVAMQTFYSVSAQDTGDIKTILERPIHPAIGPFPRQLPDVLQSSDKSFTSSRRSTINNMISKAYNSQVNHVIHNPDEHKQDDEKREDGKEGEGDEDIPIDENQDEYDEDEFDEDEFDEDGYEY